MSSGIVVTEIASLSQPVAMEAALPVLPLGLLPTNTFAVSCGGNNGRLKALTFDRAVTTYAMSINLLYSYAFL